MFGIGLGMIGGSFTPFSVAGLHSYYSADVCTQSGGTASIIQDQSLNHEVSLTTVTGNPLYTSADSNFNNQPSFSCVAAVRRVQATFNSALAQPATYYLVMGVKTNVDLAVVYWRSNAGNFTNCAGFYQFAGGTAYIQTLDAGSALACPVISVGSHVSCAIYDGTATTALYVDNSATPTALAPTDGSVDGNSNAVLTIGTFAGQEADYAWTTAIQYSGTHDAATRKKIMTFLGTKYGITTT